MSVDGSMMSCIETAFHILELNLNGLLGLAGHVNYYMYAPT